MYFRIGKIIDENAKYGNNFIDNLSKKLKMEFPEANGYSPRNLSRMRKFYATYGGECSNLPPAVANLPWTHNCILIDKIKDRSKRVWYAEKCQLNGWSKIVLDHQIDLNLYERQADPSKKLSNYESLLPSPQSELSQDMIKDPYIFELTGMKEKMIEKDIENALLEQIKTVLLELGKGFSFVGNQYRVSTPNTDYIIDLLFYHLELRSYVVVELKNQDFKPDFIGQLQFYVTAVDETLKKQWDNPTIGLLLCKGKDRYSVEWSLKSTTAPIGVASYEIRNYLPTEEELNEYLK
ncbi:MAG: DUF1016 family protein [Clostridia bacterium]|nr:DUF1016 family protein [Clostridia bacterium]